MEKALTVTQQAADAATASADATQSSVAIMEKSSMRQLRAYVGVDMKDGALDAQNNILTVLFKNGGQTPAYEVTISTEWKALAGRLIEWPDEMPFAYSSGKKRSKFSIFQGQQVPIRAPLDGLDSNSFSFRQHLDRFRTAGDVTLYFYGTANYVDAFGKPQWTNYCFYLKQAADGVKLTAYHKHNDCS